MTCVAVVGHVEWVEFVRVERHPAPGDLVQGKRLFEHAAGGAIVAAVTLTRLGADVELVCALADDARGHAAHEQLTDYGIEVRAAWRPPPTRSLFTLVQGVGERTIITVGERQQPSGTEALEWERLAAVDGVYFTAGDAAALEHARRARALVVSPRAGRGSTGRDHEVVVDATVFSAGDVDEATWARDWEQRSRLMVATEGADGGRWWGESEGRWSAAPVPGPMRDSYGAGDSFAGGFTFGLACRRPVEDAVAIGARCGADMVTRVGGP